MEQDLEVKALEQEKVRVFQVEVVAVEETVLVQDRAEIAFAQTVVKKNPINWEYHVMSRSVQNAEPR